MGRQRFTLEQINAKLREVDVIVGRSGSAVEACRQIGIAEQTLYRWRKEYGGLKVDQVRRMKDLERENAQLKKLVCLIPAFDSASSSSEWKDVLWGRFYTGAPERQRQSVERYNIVKRA